MKLSKLKKIIKESLNEQQGFPNPKVCIIDDFKATGQCAQDHFFNSPMGGIGGLTSFDSWLSNQWNAYQGNAGCHQFPAIESWTLSQITPTANCPALPGMSQFGQYGGGPNQAGNCHSLIAVKRKFAKAKWANCMTQKCCKEDNTGGDDPCKQLMADPMHSACCTKCNSGSVISPNDPCMPHCKCCKPTQGGDVRGCLNPAQSGATNIGMPCPGSVGVVTLHYEPCCNYDNTGDSCKNNPTPECYWCHNEAGPSCAPVGANLAYAQGNGFTLYQNAADCNAAESGCRPDDRDPQIVECHKCVNGYPVANQFPATQGCPPGWTPIAQFDPKDCKPGGPTDPSNPVDMVDPGMQRMRDLMEYKKPK